MHGPNLDSRVACALPRSGSAWRRGTELSVNPFHSNERSPERSFYRLLLYVVVPDYNASPCQLTPENSLSRRTYEAAQGNILAILLRAPGDVKVDRTSR